MNWTAIVIVCLAAAMVLGPVLFLQPSRRQRTLARLRAHGEKKGLRVKMETLRNETYAAYEKSWPLTAKERRRIAPWRFEKMAYVHGLHIAEYWNPQADQALEGALRLELARHLEQLPAGVQAVEVTSGGARCYWNEIGGEQTLDAIVQWLEEFVDAMVPYVRRRPSE